MAEDHLSQGLLWAVHRRERRPDELVAQVFAHLLTDCPRCREEWEEFAAEAAASGQDALFGPLFERLREALPGRKATPPGSEELGRARALVAELRALKAGARAEVVLAEPERFRGEALAEVLLGECRGCLPGHPEGAEHFARLARTVLEQTAPSRQGADLYALATAHVANGLRCLDRLEEADECMRQARFLQRHGGTGDLIAAAEVDDLEGSLRRYQRNLHEAERLFRRALFVYRLEALHRCAAHELTNLAHVLREQGKVLEAIERTREAIELLGNGEDEPRLYLMAWHNLAFWLCDAHEFFEAADVLRSTRDLYARFPDPWTQRRKTWVEARVARGLSRPEEAEGLFLAVVHGFGEDGRPYDMALAGLELGTLYAEQGRMAEIVPLVRDILPVFVDRHIHREAIGALLLLEEAATTERANAALLARLTATVEQARGLLPHPARAR